jgi:hypothetical protein
VNSFKREQKETSHNQAKKLEVAGLFSILLHGYFSSSHLKCLQSMA